MVSLGAITTVLDDLTSWRNNLRPASFRGVPFFVDQADGAGGRRKIEHQFPLRDQPSIEDLGKAANKYRIRAFLVGDTYLDDSNALISACQDFDDAAIFVHPWRGEIRCQAGVIAWHESKEQGGYCAVDIEFLVDDGGLPSPTTALDTASTLIRGIASMLQVAVAAYQTVSLMVQYPSLLLGFAGDLLGGLGTSLLGLPSIGVGTLGADIVALFADPGDDTATATAVQMVFQDAAQAVIAAQAAPADDTSDSIAGLSPVLAPAADLTGGLAAFATWGSDQSTPANPMQATQLQVLQSLIQGQAVLAVLTVYSNTDFTSSNAAANARQQVQTMLDAQLDLASTLGQDDLYRAWQALGAQALNDLITRAQALPSLISWSMQASLPSLVLAQRWYQDADRADELDMLNDVPDPMFMPFGGVRLTA